MLVVSVITLVAEFLITLLEKRLLAWRPPSQTDVVAI
jgi:NitT/TauT family transport system permease protein